MFSWVTVTERCACRSRRRVKWKSTWCSWFLMVWVETCDPVAACKSFCKPSTVTNYFLAESTNKKMVGLFGHCLVELANFLQEPNDYRLHFCWFQGVSLCEVQACGITTVQATSWSLKWHLTISRQQTFTTKLVTLLILTWISCMQIF